MAEFPILRRNQAEPNAIVEPAAQPKEPMKAIQNRVSQPCESKNEIEKLLSLPRESTDIEKLIQKTREPNEVGDLLSAARVHPKPLLQLGSVPLANLQIRGTFNEFIDPRVTALGRTACSYVVVESTSFSHPLLQQMRLDLAGHGNAEVGTPDEIWRDTGEAALIVYHIAERFPAPFTVAQLTLEHGIANGNVAGPGGRRVYRLII